MKYLLLLALTAIILPAAEMPPQPMKGVATWPSGMASLEGLPADLKQEIFRKVTQYGDALNVDALAKDILRLAGINKAWRATVNNLKNMLIILNALPRPAAISLVEKLGKLPVIQDNMLAILKTLPRSGAKYLAAPKLAKVLANTPGMQNKEVQAWLNSFKLENGRELFAAISDEHPVMARINELLANPNIDVNMEDETIGWTPLMWASSQGQAEIVKALLAANAMVNVQTGGGMNALMFASQKGYIDVVRLLLAAGADANMQAVYNITALNLASENGYAKIVEALLAAGADVNVLKYGRESALSIARQYAQYNRDRAYDYAETIKLLEDAKRAQKEKTARK